MKHRIFTLLVLIIYFSSGYAQKKTLDDAAYDIWKTIPAIAVSDDGNYISYEAKPYRGDGNLNVYSIKKSENHTLSRGYSPEFSPMSEYLVYKIKTQFDTIRSLKLKKTKADDLPKDSLGILILDKNKTIKISKLNTYKLPKEKSAWIAYTYTFSLPDSLKSKKKEKTFDKSAPKTYHLDIFNPLKDKKFTFSNVSDYEFSRNGKRISFVKLQNDTLLRSTVFTFDTESETLDSLPSVSGLADKLTCDNLGNRFSFIFSEDTVERKVYALYLWEYSTNSAKKIADSTNTEFPKNWTVSPNGAMYFSRDDTKLFFGTAQKPEIIQKDTLTDDEKIKLDLWHWNDDYIQSEQLVNLDKEKKRSYLAVYHCNKQKIVQLGTLLLKDPKTVNKGNGKLLLATNEQPYAKLRTWDVTGYRDVYVIDSESGDSEKILTNFAGSVYLSPNCKSVLYYQKLDSAWYSYYVETKQHKNLTKSIKVSFAEELYDNPELPAAYGFGGWLADEKSVWVYDRYDIWKLDLEGKTAPENITKNGRSAFVQYRYLKLNTEEEYIKSDVNLLKIFDTKSKNAGFVQLLADKKIKTLIFDNFQYSSVLNAKNSENLVFRKENTENYGDIFVSDTKFSKQNKISNLNPQQADYNWTSAELFKWKLPDGSEEEGLLYKPENFDPTKKYPMIVYFYETHSDELNSHWIPSPSRSVINPTVFASNGYLIFMPNIRYTTGEPGESALKYVLSGTKAVCKYSFVDSTKIGIQGQSWGGYQVAYLVTQTNFFKAAAAGAPVSNMFSAYGGIRWESGMSRAFQYEKTQSRIGATPWDAPELYIKNSPVFNAPNIKTPLLLVHNDKDGAVPWEQSIELYIALRRLEKPVWLLNYNGEPHNLKAESAARKDLSMRLMQFFDTYLKGKPSPVWIQDAIPAIEKGKSYGFEIK